MNCTSEQQAVCVYTKHPTEPTMPLFIERRGNVRRSPFEGEVLRDVARGPVHIGPERGTVG